MLNAFGNTARVRLPLRTGRWRRRQVRADDQPAGGVDVERRDVGARHAAGCFGGRGRLCGQRLQGRARRRRRHGMLHLRNRDDVSARLQSGDSIDPAVVGADRGTRRQHLTARDRHLRQYPDPGAHHGLAAFVDDGAADGAGLPDLNPRIGKPLAVNEDDALLLTARGAVVAIEIAEAGRGEDEAIEAGKVAEHESSLAVRQLANAARLQCRARRRRPCG